MVAVRTTIMPRTRRPLDDPSYAAPSPVGHHPPARGRAAVGLFGQEPSAHRLIDDGLPATHTSSPPYPKIGNSAITPLTLDDDQWILTVYFVLSSSPDNKISPSVSRAPPSDFQFLTNLIDCIALLIDENLQIFLTNSLFRGEPDPFLADGTEDLVAAQAYLVGLRITFSCHRCRISYDSRNSCSLPESA